MGWCYTFSRENQNFTKKKNDSPAFLKEGQVRVQPRVVGICGSDVSRIVHEIEDPALGHEWVGKVLESKSKNFKVGDTITSVAHVICGECENCLKREFKNCKERKLLGDVGVPQLFGEEAVFHEVDLISLVSAKDAKKTENDTSSQVDLKKLSLLEVAFIGDCAFNQAKRIGLKEKDKVVVFGAGAVGLFSALAFKERGYEVLVIEPKERRLDFAREAGLDALAFSRAIIEAKHFNTFDVAIDCTGDSYGPGALMAVTKFMRVFGKVVIVGKYKKGQLIEEDFAGKSLAAAWVANHQHEDFLRSIAFWKPRLELVPKSWQSTFTIEDINQAFEEAKTREHLKCAILLNGESS